MQPFGEDVQNCYAGQRKEQGSVINRQRLAVKQRRLATARQRFSLTVVTLDGGSPTVFGGDERFAALPDGGPQCKSIETEGSDKGAPFPRSSKTHTAAFWHRQADAHTSKSLMQRNVGANTRVCSVSQVLKCVLPTVLNYRKQTLWSGSTSIDSWRLNNSRRWSTGAG